MNSSNGLRAAPGARGEGAGSRLSISQREALSGYAFIAPFVLLFIIFRIIPYGMAVWLSVVDWHARGTTVFVGLKNFTDVIAMEEFRRSLVNSVLYALMVVPATTALSLLIAILITSIPRKPVQSVFQATFYLPGVVSGLAVAVIWRFIFDPRLGLLNYLVGQFGIGPVNWLGNPNLALFSLALMAILGANGAAIIIFCAALLGIPRELYDVASIDGAGFWRRHLAITMPLITPSLLYVVVLATLGALQVFIPVYVMTYGGPALATTTVGYFIYKQLMFYGRPGTAAAAGLILLAATIGLTAFQFRRFSQVVEY